jgi:hypothetical protein
MFRLVDSLGDYKAIIKERYPKIPLYDYTSKDVQFHMRAGNTASYFVYYINKVLSNLK